MTESHKWLLFLKGDKNALAEIFLAFYDDLFNYGMKLSPNPDLIKDCIQDLFLKLWKNRATINPIQIIKPYLLKSLRRHILDSIEISKPWNASEKEMESSHIIYSHEDFLINEQIDEENRQKLIHALNQLTPRQREVIYLRYFEGLDFDDIAHIMSMNVQSVRNCIHRGILSLREIVSLQLLFLTFNSMIISEISRKYI